MNVFHLFSRPICVHYYGRLCSEASIFYILITLVRFWLPLWIVWRADSFWIKESSFREMPSIDFKKDFILLLRTMVLEPDNSTEYSTFGHSTVEHIDEAFRQTNQWVPVNIAEYELDYDNDFKNDELNLNLEIPINLNEKRFQVLGFRLIAFFWYRLSDKIILHMESLADVQNYLNEPGHKVYIDGDLEFVQKTPFNHRGYEFSYNRSLVLRQPKNQSDPATVDFDENPFFLDQMLRDYASRDYQTKFVPSFQSWEPHKSAILDVTTFQIYFKIHYRDQLFQYRTGFWFLIKWALIQYMAVFFILDYFINMLKSLMFDEYLVASQAKISDVDLLSSLVLKKQF